MKEKAADQTIVVNGIAIAPGVVETVISLAAAEVPGVASVGSAGPIDLIAAALNAGKGISSTGIKVSMDENNAVAVDLTIKAYYGYRISEVADNVRTAVADAIKGQIGTEVTRVDIYVDALASEE